MCPNLDAALIIWENFICSSRVNLRNGTQFAFELR